MARASRFIWQGESCHLASTILSQSQSHSPLPGGGNIGQRSADFRLVKSKTQPGSRMSQASQVQRQSGVGPVLAAQGFDQLNARIVLAQKARLEMALRPLGCAIGIRHDATTDTQSPTSTSLQIKRTNGDIQAKIAIRLQPPQCTGVQATRLYFQLGGNLHGTYFWGSGNRTTGKKGAQNITKRNLRRDIGRNLRHHLPDGWVSLNVEQAIHVLAGFAGDPLEAFAA